MAGTKQGAMNRRETMIAKYGSEESYLEYMRSLGAKGGKNGHTGGFFADRNLARRAGAKGGHVSRRGKARIF